MCTLDYFVRGKFFLCLDPCFRCEHRSAWESSSDRRNGTADSILGPPPQMLHQVTNLMALHHRGIRQRIFAARRARFKPHRRCRRKGIAIPMEGVRSTCTLIVWVRGENDKITCRGDHWSPDYAAKIFSVRATDGRPYKGFCSVTVPQIPSNP